MNNLIGSKKIRYIIGGLIALIIVLLIFQAGVFVGYRKAFFSYRGGDRYIQMVEGPGENVGDNDFATSHGASGQIVSVSLPSFVVASPNNREETVVIGDDTSIRMFRNNASSTDIHPKEFVVVLGEPDQAGNIQASFVRILPAPVTGSSSSSNFPMRPISQ